MANQRNLIANDAVDVSIDGSVGQIWLNRPERRNAINDEMMDGLVQAMDLFESDDRVRAIVVRGRGGTFCSGADLGDHVSEQLGNSRASQKIAKGAAVLTRLADLPIPSIAVVEGYATAGGFEIMLACDFALAADDAKIGDFHIRRALIGGAGPTYRLPRIVGIRRAKELMLSGKLLTAEQALDWGLINAAAPTTNLDEAVEAFAADFTDKSPFTMRLTKSAVNQSLDADSRTLILMESFLVQQSFDSADAREGVNAFLEKREPRWQGR